MKILISSVGRRNYIVEYFQECMASKDDVIVVNSIEDSAGVFSSTKYVIAPPIASDEYIPFLLEICRENDVKLLVSLFDQDLMKISFYKEEFEKNGVTVAVSDRQVIETTFDKLMFARFLKEINLLSPKIFKDDEPFRANLENGNIEYPLILKPRWGTGSIATEKVETKKELFFFLEYLKEKIRRFLY